MPPPPVQLGVPQPLPNESKSGFLNWWQSILLALSSALAGVVFVVLVQNGAGGSTASAPAVLFRYVPHFLMLFGVLADAFTYQGVYWTGTVAGIFGGLGAPFLERIVSGLMDLVSYAFTRAKGGPAGAASVSSKVPGVSFTQDGSYDGCTFSGGSTETTSVPQMLIVTASIMWYYTVDLIDNRGMTSAIGTLFSFLALYGAQYVAIKRCITPGSNGSTLSGAFTGLVYGLVLGGIYYSIMKASAPQFLPSSVITAVDRGMGGGSSGGVTLDANGNPVTGTVGTGSTPTSCSAK